MAVNPTTTCLPCRVIKETIKNVSHNINFHFIKYLLMYLVVVEIVTIFLADLDSYAYKIFPAVTQFGYVCFLYFFYLHRYKLKFCRRKRIVVKMLFIYYFINFITIIIPICLTTFTNIISYLLLTTVGITLLLTILKKE